MNILLVEDEPRVSEFIARGLRAERHTVTVIADGEVGLEVASGQSFDVIILDLLLPRMHGHEVCQTLRQRGIATPVLMLSALGTVDNRVTGLRLGADDYLAKPFAFDELLARLDVLARRVRGAAMTPPALVVGDLVFDRETLDVTHGGEKLKLTAKELAVLELLMSMPGKVFSRERILSHVWDLSEDPLTNVVDVYIGRLRKQLRSSGGNAEIQTLRGMGFRIAVGTSGEGQP